MRSRREFHSADSLELLLDTITNAFGGILFLAILVVVLLQGTGKNIEHAREVDEPSAADLVERLREREAALATISLEAKAVQTVAEHIAEPKLTSTLESLQLAKDRRDQLAKEKSQLVEKLATRQTQLEALAQKDAQLDS